MVVQKLDALNHTELVVSMVAILDWTLRIGRSVPIVPDVGGPNPKGIKIRERRNCVSTS